MVLVDYKIKKDLKILKAPVRDDGIISDPLERKIISEGLVLYLKFNEGSGTIAYDLSGYKNNGTIYGATWTYGKYGYALSFDGVDDYAYVPITFYGWQGFTVAQWFYPVWPKVNDAWSKTSMIGDFWTDKIAIFIGTNNRTDYTYCYVYFYTRKLDGTAANYFYNIFDYRNSWVHIAQTFSLTDRVYRVYVNGELKYSTTIPSDNITILEMNPDTATNPTFYKRFVLGASVNFTEWITSKYDEVRIYNRVLSPEEIRAIYLGYG